jgi:alpha-amylase/alpha-mannosidase (GH57 family)
MRSLPGRVFSHSNFTFNTPSELGKKLQPVSSVHVPYPISWADEERDLTAWLGNELQDEAFDKLYSIKEKVGHCDDPDIKRDWIYLQTSDHFYYMCTKWFSDGDVHKYFNPYGTPYEAFINYMNVLSDFMIRVDENYKEPSFQKQAEQTLKNVADMSNAKIKELISKVDMDELVLVLQNTTDDVRERVIPNLGVRAKKKYEQLQDEIKKVKKSDLLKYTNNVEKELRKLFK